VLSFLWSVKGVQHPGDDGDDAMTQAKGRGEKLGLIQRAGRYISQKRVQSGTFLNLWIYFVT